MLSVWVWPKVITLSGFYCILKYECFSEFLIMLTSQHTWICQHELKIFQAFIFVDFPSRIVGRQRFDCDVDDGISSDDCRFRRHLNSLIMSNRRKLVCFQFELSFSVSGCVNRFDKQFNQKIKLKHTLCCVL